MVVVVVVVMVMVMMKMWQRQLNWLSHEVTYRPVLAMRRKWALREVKVTSLDGTFTSFFLSFFLSLSHTHTHCVVWWSCCWMHGRMKASKKAFSYSNMYHSHVFHLFIHLLSHSLLIFTSHTSCYEYVKLVWTSLRMRCVVGWLAYIKAVSVVDTQVVFGMSSINRAACSAAWA
jgi:hypothetical protein